MLAFRFVERNLATIKDKKLARTWREPGAKLTRT